MVEESDPNESSTRLEDPDPKLWHKKSTNLGWDFLWVFLWWYSFDGIPVGGISYGCSYDGIPLMVFLWYSYIYIYWDPESSMFFLVWILTDGDTPDSCRGWNIRNPSWKRGLWTDCAKQNLLLVISPHWPFCWFFFWGSMLRWWLNQKMNADSDSDKHAIDSLFPMFFEILVPKSIFFASPRIRNFFRALSEKFLLRQ